MREIEGLCIQGLKPNFSTPKPDLGCWLYRQKEGKKWGEKRGGKQTKFPPKMAKPPDMGVVENKIYG